MMRGICAVLLVYLSKWIISVSSQDVISCGGFINSKIPLEFSKIMVRLHTKEMNLKYETDCAPNNGYYMIPVYSKGVYIIRVHPPDGWVFEPEQIEINVDGVDDPCTSGQDINFSFKGFSIIGQVLSASASEGPENVAVGLFKDGEKSAIATTTTAAGGKFIVKGVLPGKYRVALADSGLCSDDSSSSVVVKDATVTLPQSLRINGYGVRGSVKNDAQAVSGAHILLFAQSKTIIKNCDSTPIKDFIPPAALSNYHFVCKTTSQTNGDFSFGCVPTGAYIVVAHYKNDGGVAFDLLPKTLSVNVKHEHITLTEPFRIVGFTVPGRVLWKENGDGVGGAEILVNDKPVSRSDANGNFILEGISVGKYKIIAKLDNVEFSAVEVDLSPKNHRIPNLVALKFNMCGKVILQEYPASLPKLKQRKLLLMNVDTKEVLSITTDSDGLFCRMMPRGVYVLEPQVLPNEKQAGISIVPAEKKVTVADKPVMNLVFSQFEAKISGVINCIGICKKLKLHLLQHNEIISTQEVPTFDKKHSFEFARLLGGEYTVTLKSDSYCWEKSELRATISENDVGNLNFRQTGFGLTVSSPNKATLFYVNSKNEKVTFNLLQGSNTFCVSAAGVYNMELDSCHQFEPKSFKFDTNNPSAVSLTAVKHLVKGTVTVPTLVKDIFVIVNSNKHQQTKLGPLVKPSNTTGRYVYEFVYWAEPNEELNLEAASTTHLFLPEKHTTAVTNDCQLAAVNFVGTKGLFLNGIVDPPLKDVKITMSGNKLVHQCVTDTHGRCDLGPLRSFDGYEVTAELLGYSFQAVSGKLGTFKAFKLSELIIQALDSNNKLLSGVLISVSGTQFRSNNMTDESGTITLVGLSPGEYFIRPVLKEYSFIPATRLVEIREGSTEKVQVSAKRVAYSCSGVLRYLGGQPAENVVMEAVSPGCNQLQEESVTGEDGSFRILGLQPGCDYSLRVKPSQGLPATYPRHMTISVKEEDVTGLMLVLRPQFSVVDIAGRVACDKEHLSSLRVVLVTEDAPHIPVHSVQLQSSVFFIPPVNADNSIYIARLETSLNPSLYDNLRVPDSSFAANGTLRYLEFEFKPKRKLQQADISKSSYVVFLLAVVIMLLIYHYEKVLPVARDWSQFAMAHMGHQRARSTNRKPTAPKAEPIDNVFDSFDDSQNVGGDPAMLKKRPRLRKT